MGKAYSLQPSLQTSHQGHHGYRTMQLMLSLPGTLLEGGQEGGRGAGDQPG